MMGHLKRCQRVGFRDVLTLAVLTAVAQPVSHPEGTRAHLCKPGGLACGEGSACQLEGLRHFWRRAGNELDECRQGIRARFGGIQGGSL